MLTTIETNIIRGLIQDETFTRKALPYIKTEYFENNTGRSYFGICERFFSEYNQCIDIEATKHALENLEGISSDEFEELGRVFESIFEPTTSKTEWLIDET